MKKLFAAYRVTDLDRSLGFYTMLLRRCPAGGRRLCRKTVSRHGWMYDVACPGGG